MSKFSQNLPKTTPNPRKIFPNFALGALLGPLGPVLGPLGAKKPSRTKKHRKTGVQTPPRASILGGFSSHVGAMLGHVALQERMTTTSCELVHQGLHLTPQTWPTWSQLSPTWRSLTRLSMELGGLVVIRNRTKINQN